MLPNRYDFQEAEPRLARFWDEQQTYAFDAKSAGPTFTIDTPPPTVSGELHIGHCYSYTQTDVIARFHRMLGERVLYPMGFDDNGLPTERFVEKTIGRKATEMDTASFLEQCLTLIRQTEDRFERLWRRLGLSVDWHYRYSTMAPESQRTSQWSFIQLYQMGLAYMQQAPTLWCPECHTAIAQAELEDSPEMGRNLQQAAGEHSIDIHERCGTPVEYRHTRQWFIRILDAKEQFLEAGRKICWQPAYMQTRYEHWVEQLQWDWCISRQRYLGVPFPAWMCRACGKLLLATREELPIDPRITPPSRLCACGANDFEPERDVMDTWATSSCTPLIIGRWVDDPAWFAQHFPAQLRAQAHDIIRTWAFYTIVKTLYHTGKIPWETLMISGHALSEQRSKISKSKGSQGVGPIQLIEQASADAMRYWATSTRTGHDTPWNAETLATGRRLVTKLWNACRFAESQFDSQLHAALANDKQPECLLPTDRWLLSRLAHTISYATQELRNDEYATARAEVERFFWSDLCDNYLELIKGRLYGANGAERLAAQWTLYHALLTVLHLFAPYLPYVTEELYQQLFRPWHGANSIHRSTWPAEHAEWHDPQAEEAGQTILELLRSVRRSKAEQGLSIGAELPTLHMTIPQAQRELLIAALPDLKSATRAREIVLE